MTQVLALPQTVIAEDQRLESTAERASIALMDHRWHWTLDESNPDRVSINAYSLAVGKNHHTIHAYAHGFIVLHESAGACTPEEARQRAVASAEQAAVIDAVATARGQSFSYVQREHRAEIQHVRNVARDNAERHGTPVADEAQKFAEFLVQAEQAQQITADQQRARKSTNYFELDRLLVHGRHYLALADKFASTVTWAEEEEELLADLKTVIEQIERLTHHIDRRIAGMRDLDINWEQEVDAILAKNE